MNDYEFGVLNGTAVEHQSLDRDEVIASLLYDMRQQEILQYSGERPTELRLVVREYDYDDVGPWALADISDDELRSAALEFSGVID